jgi:hypothetical protein
LGRGAPPLGHPVVAKRESAREVERPIDVSEGKVVNKERDQVAFLVPFLLGAVVGGFGGAIFGTLMAPYFSAVRSLIGKVVRKGDSDQPKFELLLQ